jgi:hypothetical protein
MPSICDQLEDLSDRLARLEEKVEGKEEEEEEEEKECTVDFITEITPTLWAKEFPDGRISLDHSSDMKMCRFVGRYELLPLRDYLSSLLART